MITVGAILFFLGCFIGLPLGLIIVIYPIRALGFTRLEGLLVTGASVVVTIFGSMQMDRAKIKADHRALMAKAERAPAAGVAAGPTAVAKPAYDQMK